MNWAIPWAPAGETAAGLKLDSAISCAASSAADTTTEIRQQIAVESCIDALDEGPCGYWTVAPAPRKRLAALLEGREVRLIASGHLHIQRHKEIDGVSHVWAPASSFVVGAAQQDLGGERILGYAEHVFDGEEVTSRFVRPDGVEELLLDPVAKEIYAPRPT